jgi:RNA polymerase sigma factor (sigma-70 family)
MDAVRVAEHREIEAVYREHGKRLWWAVLAFAGDREIASDAVAEAFAQALRGAGRIRSPADWVWTVAFRVASGELERRRRFGPVAETSYEIDPSAASVISSLAKLSPRQRSAVVLHYYGGFTAKEIGAMTGSTGATVAVHLHRARKQLRHLLEDAHD